MTFRDREEGGYLLARQLMCHRGDAPVVLALPLGGIPVAFPVAVALGALLDVLVVRRDGSVDRATTPPAGAVLTEDGLRKARLATALRALAERQTPGLLARLCTKRREPTPPIADRTVIIVDDVVATGQRAYAASVIVRRRGAARVIVAAPVIARPAQRALEPVTDAIAAVRFVPHVRTIEDWYERLEHLSEDAVLGYVERALWARSPARLESDLWDGEWIGPETTEEESDADLRRDDPQSAAQRRG